MHHYPIFLSTTKRTAFLLAAALTAATAAFSSAQVQAVRFGVRAGANLSNLAGNLPNQNTYGNKFGFVGGVTANFGFGSERFISLQPEVLYSQKGFQNKPSEYNATILGYGYTLKREGNVNVNLNYIDVPVLVKINAGGFVIEAGPQYSYLLNANNKTTTTQTVQPNGTPQTSEATNQTDASSLRRSELGYVAGSGFQADNGVGLSLRYSGSFNDFVKNDNSSYAPAGATGRAAQLAAWP